MKYKTTRKQIMNSGRKVIKIGYCEVQYLLQYHNENAYTTRVEGWGADIYDIGSVTICTGYAPFGNITPKYDVVHKYEDLAREVVLSNLKYENKKEQVEVLFNEFITEVTL